MQVSVEQLGALERKMTVRMPASRIEDRVKTRLRELGQTVRIKGFRPGKVPAKVVEQRFGAQVRSEALNDVVGASFEQAVTEHKLRPAMMPSIARDPSTTADEFVYVASFEVMPELGPVDLNEVELVHLESEVLAEDVDRMIDTLRQQRRKWLPVDRAAAEGDMIVFEFFAEGEGIRTPAEGTDRAGTIIGSGALFKSLDEGLTGLKAGDEKTIAVTFPAEFREPALANKEGTFSVSVLRVQASEMPALDDAFAASFGVASGGVEQFRKDVRANLEREMHNTLIARNKLHAVERLVNKFPQSDLPKTMIAGEANSLLRQAQEQAKRAGREQDAPMDAEVFKDTARARVAASVLLDAIARQAEVKLDHARVNEALATIASTYEEPQQVIEMYTKDAQMMSGLRRRVVEDQVIDIVFAKAKSTPQKITFRELMQPTA
ncbi:MAG: trigger factor [Ahniella sp.]|nr:trigger factor [Ahniella sp.]